jgi:hypothetical protein
MEWEEGTEDHVMMTRLNVKLTKIVFFAVSPRYAGSLVKRRTVFDRTAMLNCRDLSELGIARGITIGILSSLWMVHTAALR